MLVPSHPVAFSVALAVAGVGTSASLAGCTDGRQTLEEDGVSVELVRINYNNSYVVRSGEARILIDSGLERDAALLQKRLEEADVPVTDLDAVVVTHGHADHAGGALAFRTGAGLPVYLGAGDEDLLAAGGADTLCPTDDFARDRMGQDGGERFVPFDADEILDDADDLARLTGLDGTLAFGPSHTDGSVSVVVGPFAFVGDLFRGDIFAADARVHFYICDLDQNRADIRRLLEEHPEVTTFLPGHFGPLSRETVVDLVENRWPEPEDDQG